MTTAADMHARHARVLAELGEIGLAAARELNSRLAVADTAEEAAKLAMALQRMSRSLRQTLALEARIAREAERDVREADDRTRHALAEGRRAVVHAHRRQVLTRVERLIWSEHEADEAGELDVRLAELLDWAEEEDGFTETPVEALVARLCADLGLAVPTPGETDPGEAAHPPPPAAASTPHAAYPGMRERWGLDPP